MRVVRGGAAVLVLVCAASARAQPGPNEQARGLLEDGRAYMKSGKTKQAVDNFNTIVSGFSGTDSVDDALLEIGRWQMDVEHNADKAREAFEDVTKRFPSRTRAPGAYYYLGRLALARATTSAELDDALAQFVRVQRLYPGSEWVPRSLHGCALVHRKAGRLPDAVEPARRVALEYPNSEAAPEAYLRGRPRARADGGAAPGDGGAAADPATAFPQSEWAPRAPRPHHRAVPDLRGPRARLRARPRVHAGRGRRPEGRAGADGDARRPDLGRLRQQVKGVVPFGADGKMGPSLTGVDLAQLCRWALRASCWWPRGWRCAWARTTSSRSRSPATSPARRSRWSASRPRCSRRRKRAGRGRQAAEGVPLRRQIPVQGRLPRRQGARGRPA